jgi:hypothetical protein
MVFIAIGFFLINSMIGAIASDLPRAHDAVKFLDRFGRSGHRNSHVVIESREYQRRSPEVFE